MIEKKAIPMFVGPRKAEWRASARVMKPDIVEHPRNALPLLAFDPGQTTGWSLIVLPRKGLDGKDIFSSNFETLLLNRLEWRHGQINCEHEDFGAREMMKLCEKWPNAAVLVEDFILRANRNEMTRNLLSPVRVTAKLEHYLWRVGRQMILQQPSMAKTTVTDDRLKIWNCYVPGQPHARDADRHILTYIRRCYGPQGVSARLAAWPYAYEVKVDSGRKGKEVKGVVREGVSVVSK